MASGGRGRRVRETVPVEVLRVDGGLTRDPTLLQLQADAAGVPVQRGAVDATVAGAAALAAVGAGVWGSTREIAERIPAGERTEPKRDDAWRNARTPKWREFVQRAVALSGLNQAGEDVLGALDVLAHQPHGARPSRRRSSATSRRCCSLECVSTCSGCAIRAIRSLI